MKLQIRAVHTKLQEAAAYVIAWQSEIALAGKALSADAGSDVLFTNDSRYQLHDIHGIITGNVHLLYIDDNTASYKQGKVQTQKQRRLTWAYCECCWQHIKGVWCYACCYIAARQHASSKQHTP